MIRRHPGQVRPQHFDLMHGEFRAQEHVIDACQRVPGGKGLARTRDFQDAMRIQAEFMQSQFTALSEQTKSLGEAYARSAADAVNKTAKM